MCCSNHSGVCLPIWHPHTAKNIDILEHVQWRAALWATGSRRNPSSYRWSKSSDDCLKELKWPYIQKCYIYFSIRQLHDILHQRNLISFLTIFSYPEILQNQILSPLQLPHCQTTHTNILFTPTVLFYGMLFLMPFCKSNSLIYSILPYVVFFFDIGFSVYAVFGCFYIVPCSLCVFCLYLV